MQTYDRPSQARVPQTEHAILGLQDVHPGCTRYHRPGFTSLPFRVTPYCYSNNRFINYIVIYRQIRSRREKKTCYKFLRVGIKLQRFKRYDSRRDKDKRWRKNDKIESKSKKAESELAQNAVNHDTLSPQKVPYSDSSSAIDCKMLTVSASSTACSFITFRP